MAILFSRMGGNNLKSGYNQQKTEKRNHEHVKNAISNEGFEARVAFLRKKVDLEEGFYGFRVGSRRSVGRRFAFSTSSASHQRHLSSLSLYMV